VWSTGFFGKDTKVQTCFQLLTSTDKNVVGSSNALTGGWGNAGGGITYFVMPAIFDSLVQKQHLSLHVAWRVSFIVPFILITVTAISMLIFCPDTPTGKWADRHLAIQNNFQAHGTHVLSDVVTVPGSITDRKIGGTATPTSGDEKCMDEEADIARAKHGSFKNEATMGQQEMLDAARGEVVVKPTFKEAVGVIFSLQTASVAACYFCSFGAELAVNSILGAYYLENFPKLGQTGTGRWAAMFGLLNVVFRPLGGMVSDAIYRKTHSIWHKKIWLHALAVLTGAFLIAIGVVDSRSHSVMFGLVAGMAFFLQAGNGANFALVPHIHPFANGIISGVTGACGNLGGVIFAIIFRYNGIHYGKVFWIIGVMTIGINLLVCWVNPIPKGQIGGR
jgi:NNP family nitrate/nitrite transporter-like MFS transporter